MTTQGKRRITARPLGTALGLLLLISLSGGAALAGSTQNPIERPQTQSGDQSKDESKEVLTPTVAATITPAPNGSTITAIKLDDRTGQPLQGWTMVLHAGFGCTGAVLGTGVTDQNGQVQFTGLAPGSYSVEEVLQPGWVPVTGVCQDVTLPAKTATVVVPSRTPTPIRTSTAIAPTPTVVITATSTAVAPTFTRTNTPTNTRTNTAVVPTGTATPPACAVTTYMSTDVPKTIGPDAGTVTTSTLTIPTSMIIGNIEVVSVDITHTFANDLDVFLISPTGAITVELFTDLCGTLPWPPGSTGFTLSQSASNVIGSACPPGNGTYRPEGSLAPLFGTDAQGTWTLRIVDDANVDQGVLYGWGLRITGQGCPTSTPDPSFTPTNTRTPTSTRTATRTPTATATGGVSTATRTPITVGVFNGSIASGDPSHVNYLDIDSTASTCAANDTCPGVFSDASPYRYDTYSFTNTSGSTVCYTITVNGSACGSGSFGLWAFAYLNSYNPASLCTNYLGDDGNAAITGVRSFSVNVPAGQTLIVEIEEYIAGAGCASYSGTVVQAAMGEVTEVHEVHAQPANPVSAPNGAKRAASDPENFTVTVTFRNRSVTTPTVTTPTVTTPTVTTPTVTPTRLACTGRVTICHQVGNGSFREITISCNALPAHIAHGDLYPVPPGGCPAAPHPQYFTDVPPSHTFFHDISDLYELGAISGYPDGQFRAEASAKRAHIAKIAVLAHGVAPIPGGPQHFLDVAPGSPYFGYVEAAFAQGWVVGYSDGLFRPYEDVTRGQIAKISVRASGEQIMVPANNEATFSDVPAGSTFYEYVETAYANGMISGYPDGTFRPGTNATRGQLAKVIMRGTHP